jgi:hypothetical protein
MEGRQEVCIISLAFICFICGLQTASIYLYLLPIHTYPNILSFTLIPLRQTCSGSTPTHTFTTSLVQHVYRFYSHSHFTLFLSPTCLGSTPTHTVTSSLVQHVYRFYSHSHFHPFLRPTCSGSTPTHTFTFSLGRHV